MTDTVLDIVTSALRKIGVLAEGETASAAQGTDALGDLNSLIDSNATDRLQIYTTKRVAFPLRDGVQDYLLGLGPDQQVDTADGFDSNWSGAPPDWTATTSGAGQVLDDTVTAQAGGRSVNMIASSGAASIYRDFVVPAGSSVTIGAWLLASFTSTGFVRVTNQETGSTLTTAGGWDPAASTDVFECDAGVAFVQHSKTFNVESAAIVGAAFCALRVTLRCAATNFDCWFDTFTFNTTGVAAGIERPIYIDRVNVVDTANSTLEMPLQGPMTDMAWEGLRQKDLTSTLPYGCYYNPTFPYGTLSFWPVPDSSTLEAAIYVPAQVQQFATLNDTFSLPPGYKRMLTTNLALELAPEYGAKPSQLLMMQARDAMDTVKRANVRMVDLKFDAGSLCGSSRPWYDIRLG